MVMGTARTLAFALLLVSSLALQSDAAPADTSRAKILLLGFRGPRAGAARAAIGEILRRHDFEVVTKPRSIDRGKSLRHISEGLGVNAVVQGRTRVRGPALHLVVKVRTRDDWLKVATSRAIAAANEAATDLAPVFATSLEAALLKAGPEPPGPASPPATARSGSEADTTALPPAVVMPLPPAETKPVAPAHAATAATVPRLTATRIGRAPLLDGKLDDDVWGRVPITKKFTQKFPGEGQTPSEPTSIRVAYDDEALYVGIDCEQRGATVNRHLTRRDRMVESDWVAVAIDTRHDGKSAFDFNVNAAGVLVDSIRFNDTDVSTDWDENWDARTALTESGWSAEMRIPLRVLRFDSAPLQTWGFEARRYISQMHETDEWAYIPRSRIGEVSQYGTLEDLRSLNLGSGIELSPFVLSRLRRRDVRGDQLANGRDLALSAGLDLKWHLSQALTVDAAINPDFAQVEADQVILNLTNFEPTFPEKRRFFVEGIDTFATPSLQLLYTRRIGRATPAPVLADGEQLVEAPEPASIYGAAKLTAHLGQSLELGALSAVTGRNEVTVQLPDGSRVRRLADPLSIYNAVRIKRSMGDNGHIGLLATSAVHSERADDRPMVSAEAGQSFGLCPDGSHASPGQRCASNAHVAGLDWRWRSPSGDYSTNGQLVASLLEGGAPREVPDGTVIRSGDRAPGVYGYFGKEGGQHWLWDFYCLATARKFELNDLGYNDRANQVGGGGSLVFRTLEPWTSTLETRTRAETWAWNNMDGLNIGRNAILDFTVKFRNFWQLDLLLHYHGDHFDDREVGNGAALERAAATGPEFNVTTDPSGRVSGRLSGTALFLRDAINFKADATVTLRLLSQLDLELIPQALFTRGEPRYAGTAASGDYIFGRLAARSLGATLRATYTFTPKLTLQAYTQVFLAAKHYSDFSAFTPSAAEPRPILRFSRLNPLVGAPPITNPDAQEAAVDVNLVLRWEFRPGSLLYFVYTRSQVPDVVLAPTQNAVLDLRSLRGAPAADIFLLKLSYWWG
jgi:hypothetical protein